MEKIILPTLTFLLLLSSCHQKILYTQSSPEIDTYKKVVADYTNKDWNDILTHYAESARILNNVTENNAQTIAQLIAMDKGDATGFSNWGYTGQKYEMIINDQDETWVHFNSSWEVTLNANKKLYQMPGQINVQFVNGKIIKVEDYWDISKLTQYMQSLQDSAKKMNGGG